ncbi:MAG: 2-hydroxyacid dehydrogenase [Oscillospiraceae bacterium]|nr:2-hydroxyacid dehydrogenase [Oscillospiraceae bacterium]
MDKIAFFDTKPYDKIWFDKLNTDFEIKYIDYKLTPDTASAAKGCKAVVVFVNDTLSSETIDELCALGVKLIALRCSGYNNVDLRYAKDKIDVVRVPVYSPYAVAEHTMALLLTLNRKIHKAFIRTRDFNFSLNGLTGFDLHGKTVGVIGTGQIGRIFIDICRGFGMRVIAYDPYPAEGFGIDYVTPDKLFAESDVISLHCPLTSSTRYIINEASLAKMKEGVFILNTSRGQLIDSDALLQALKDGKVRGAGLDVYEEETSIFFEDYSSTIIQDDVLALLVSMPNVIMTSHQAFLTDEALQKIAEVTLFNLNQFFKGEALQNAVTYQEK